MKKITLTEILPLIDGKVISGPETQDIKNTAQYGVHVITDQSLVFVMNKRKNIRLPDNLSSITVITSNPSALNNIKKDSTVVLVSNVKRAYSRFIYYYRNLFSLPVIGITGTSGKTTVKEMITWILSKRQKVAHTYLSKNGLNKNLDYLMEIDDRTDSAVFEMGVSGPNQLLYSAFYFRPQIGIITTIGTDHLEGFKTTEAYIKEKLKMVRAVGQNGTLILNEDDENCKQIDLRNFKGKVYYYGTSPSADFQARNISFDLDQGGMNFILSYKKKDYKCFVPGYGTHNVYNALAAIIASSLVGVSIPDAIRRLKTFQHIKSHLQFHNGKRGSIVIDDTWNTNPTSINSALEVLKETSQGRKKIAIIGEMEELGNHSVAEHQRVGEFVVKHDVDVLITIGKNARPICQKSYELGMKASSIHNINSKSDLFKILDKEVNENTSILLKTSMRKSFKDTLNSMIIKEKD